MAPIQVTVVIGSPAKDGRRVLDALLRTGDGQRAAAIVPDNDDWTQGVDSDSGIIPTTEELLQLGAGCSCCTVRGDIRSKVHRLATQGAVDHILVQTEPSNDLSVLAKTFSIAGAAGSSILHLARLERLLAVVDVPTAVASLQSTTVRRLIARIELANVLWLDRAAEVAPEQLATLIKVFESINPGARIVRGGLDDVSVADLTVSRPFDLDAAASRPALAGVRDGALKSGGGVSRLVYRKRQPFHPVRLRAFIDAGWPGLVRAHGRFWVASRPGLFANLDVVGGSWQSSLGGMWWASVPVNRQPPSAEFRAYLKSIWHPAFGDRHQELAMVGVGVDEDALRAALDQCLLTEDELANSGEWSRMPHPFDWPEALA